ncbi:uncharacterized protein [Nicotiana sylvestris]|uniref:uncharacterized protein n=1 Tax=Nicotiana sylvestris TaxID=4096 RepID=UPI00388CE220
MDPSKVKAIQDLPPSRSKKDVKSFLGRLNYISRFIAQSTVICGPIFKMLRKDAETSWTEDCQKALTNSRRQHDETGIKEQAIYYLSKKFTPYEAQGNLYRRTPDLGLLRCVDAKEASKPLEDVHAGICDPHMNGFVLAKKILRDGYFWMTMETDCVHYVRKCYQCQVHANMIIVPPNELNATSSPWPFAAWVMDVIAPIEPTASNGHRFILVAIDYLTIWVEVVSYKAVTKKAIADFVKDHIVC